MLVDLHLGEFEQLVLLALIRLDWNAYGVTIRREIEDRTRREVTLGTVYKTLERMERKGYVSARVGEPTPERGGRRKKFYRLEPRGAKALNQSFGALQNMARGLVRKLEGF